jgi:hypothetical protein
MREEIDWDDFVKQGTLKDGQRVTIPMVMMDAWQRSVAGVITDAFGQPAGHRSGYCFSSDTNIEQRRAAARDEYDAAITSAWQNPRPASAATPVAPTATNDAVADAYRAYDHALANRWRQP